MVPDGAVPAALRAFLGGVGVRAAETAEAAARVVAANCEAVQWAELARARETAAQLEGLGLHMPALLGDAEADTAPCAACGCAARRLFHVRAGSPEGATIVGRVDERVGAAARRRVQGKLGRRTLQAVREHHAAHGVYVCVACAARRMAEARAEAARPAEREAAEAALAIARQASDEAGEGVGATATGALVRR